MLPRHDPNRISTGASIAEPLNPLKLSFMVSRSTLAHEMNMFHNSPTMTKGELALTGF